jgi:glycosyltransferase involved in cell wall biosynthesis
MLDIVVAVNDDDVLSKNLLRSPLLNSADISIQIQKGYRSASAAYNAGMVNCRNDIIVFVHQDVYIPLGWELKLAKHIEYLDNIDPNWAVLGLFGAEISGKHVGYVWSSGLNSEVGAYFEKPISAASVDELLIVLKKSSEISFDLKLPGFHLYGTDLVQAALAAGKSAYVICAPVIHNSKPILYLASDYFNAYAYIAAKWKDKLPIPNCVCPVTNRKIRHLIMRLRHKIKKLRNMNVKRESLDRQYDCIELSKKLGFE